LWRAGQAKTLGDYDAEFPQLQNHEQARGEIAFEEFRQRILAGQETTAEQWRLNYGIDVSGWPSLKVSSSSHRESHAVRSGERSSLLRDPVALVDRWRPGSRFGDFVIVGPLGEGAHASVFLATQGELANRFVVLKVSSAATDEPQLLAELQHTNIMPILSVHQVGAHLAICMPFLGAATLRDLQRFAREESVSTVFDQACLETVLSRKSDEIRLLVDQRGVKRDVTRHGVAGHSNVLLEVARRGRVSAILWLVQRIAEGLAHAHQHGIVHGDLKPANILISDDGQPLLLDFHLSQWLPMGEGIPEGGTLPYMAPEHLRGMSQEGRIDQRSDIYSLGVILYELLTERTPYPLPRLGNSDAINEMLALRSKPPAAIRHKSPGLSVDLDSIVQKCLALEPADRYQSCDELITDLQRHLGDQPLLHARRRSWSEMGRKWWRRNGTTARWSALVAVGVVGCVLLATFLALRTGQVRDLTAAADSARIIGELDAATIPLTEVGDEALDTDSSRREALDRLSLADADLVSTWLRSPRVERLSADERTAERNQIAQVYFWLVHAELHHARVRASDPSSLVARWNRLASEFAESPSIQRAVEWQRQQLSGQRQEMLASLLEHSVERCETSEECVMLASILVAQGGILDGRLAPRIMTLAERAIELQPENYSAWILLGNEQARAGELERAISSFSVGIAISPDNPRGRLHRGLAYFQAKQYENAAEDFRLCARAAPEEFAPRFNVVIAYYELGRFEDARRELDELLASTEEESSRVRLTSAKIWGRLNQFDNAREDLLKATQCKAESELDRIAQALAHYQLGQIDLAVETFDGIVQAFPQSVAARQNLAHLYAEKRQDLSAAIAEMDEVVARVASDPQRLAEALAARGILWSRQGNEDLALNDGREAVTLRPGPETYCQMAGIHANLGLNAATREDGSAESHRINAMQWLAKAAWENPRRVSEQLDRDPDLANLRFEPGFAEFEQTLNRLDELGK
ncbi:MAG: protein kinase, partial [Planctomycetales bacterium]|nr:protein kinase [Planctomycetales bacterium]